MGICVSSVVEMVHRKIIGRVVKIFTICVVTSNVVTSIIIVDKIAAFDIVRGTSRCNISANISASADP